MTRDAGHTQQRKQGTFREKGSNAARGSMVFIRPRRNGPVSAAVDDEEKMVHMQSQDAIGDEEHWRDGGEAYSSAQDGRSFRGMQLSIMDVEASVRSQRIHGRRAVLAANEQRAHPAGLLHRETVLMRRTQISTQVGRRAGSRPALPLADVLRLLWHLVQGRQRQRGTQPAGRRAPRPGSNTLAAQFGVEDMRAQLYLHIGAGSGASTTTRREREFSGDLRVVGASI
ncbi:hypothetical protein HWV62_24366 [Athelia sp. TMB]|nr:hypothetical protein HWV62_24366 [Athelia sp. TMB]